MLLESTCSTSGCYSQSQVVTLTDGSNEIIKISCAPCVFCYTTQAFASVSDWSKQTILTGLWVFGQIYFSFPVSFLFKLNSFQLNSSPTMNNTVAPKPVLGYWKIRCVSWVLIFRLCIAITVKHYNKCAIKFLH